MSVQANLARIEVDAMTKSMHTGVLVDQVTLVSAVRQVGLLLNKE